MRTYDLQALKTIAERSDRASNFTKAQAEEMRQNAVFVCEDRDYFVLKTDCDQYVAMIGAELLNADEFELNFAYTFGSRDGAIACALAWSCSDAGGAESTMTAPREMSTFVSAWS